MLSGEACQIAATFKVPYDGATDTYCQRQNDLSALAEPRTGLDVAAATAEATTMLASWTSTPTFGDRRRLPAVFAAAGDHGSALVQWSRLREAQGLPEDDLNAALFARLESLRVEQNETSLISVRLAVLLGPERLHPSDDHTADSIQNAAADGFAATIQELWKQPDALAAVYRERITRLQSPQAVLDLYRSRNSPDGQQAVLDGEWRSALAEDSKQRLGRQYVAWRETRNLRMATNIRSHFGSLPGPRVLMIVGASHKPDLGACLDLMHEVQIQDVTRLLRQAPGRGARVSIPRLCGPGIERAHGIQYLLCQVGRG